MGIRRKDMEKMRMVKVPVKGIMFAETVEVGGVMAIAPEIGAEMFEIVRPRAFARLDHPELVMLVDESGALKDLPMNPTGSELYGWREHGARIYGDVLIAKEVRTSEGDYDIAGLTEDEAEEAISIMYSI